MLKVTTHSTEETRITHTQDDELGLVDRSSPAKPKHTLHLKLDSLGDNLNNSSRATSSRNEKTGNPVTSGEEDSFISASVGTGQQQTPSNNNSGIIMPPQI
jgi:hypothetical protein